MVAPKTHKPGPAKGHKPPTHKTHKPGPAKGHKPGPAKGSHPIPPQFLAHIKAKNPVALTTAVAPVDDAPARNSMAAIAAVHKPHVAKAHHMIHGGMGGH